MGKEQGRAWRFFGRALLGLRASHPALRRGEVQFVPAGADRVVRY